MTWIKICGIAQREDLEEAVRLEADALGLIAVPDTPRCVSEEEIAQLSRVPRGKAKLVLVLRGCGKEFTQRMIDLANPDLLQFHGSESASFALSFGLPYIKAVCSLNRETIELLTSHSDASYWMIDTVEFASGLADKKLLDEIRSSGKQIILAGGLTPENVAGVIERYAPDGVDVSSGIELKPRHKNRTRMREFADAVRKYQD